MSYASVVLADSPTLFFELDDASTASCADSSGNGFNGSYNGSGTGIPTVGVSPLITVGTAVSFPGLNGSGAGVGAKSAFNCTTSRLSVEAWVKSSDAATSSPEIICADDSGLSRFFQFRINTSGKLEWILFDSGNTTHTATSSATINDGNTHHVVGTYDGSVMRLYVDGVADGTLTATFTVKATSPAIFVAKRRSNSTDSAMLNGIIDEAAYYNGTVLSAARVTAHYNAGLGLSGSFVFSDRRVARNHLLRR